MYILKAMWCHLNYFHTKKNVSPWVAHSPTPSSDFNTMMSVPQGFESEKFLEDFRESNLSPNTINDSFIAFSTLNWRVKSYSEDWLLA